MYRDGAQDERLNLTSAVINYDWDSATLLSASNWIRMHRFSEQDLSFLGVQAFGVNLPCGMSMTAEKVDYVCEMLIQILQSAR